MLEGLLLLGLLALLLVVGVPVAFAVGLSATFAMLWNLPVDAALSTAAQRIATSLDSFPLLAIPFFVLAGELMNAGGSARRLVDLAYLLLGRLPGALALVHIAASMLFGSISGSAVATASAMGTLMGPRMREQGYGRDLGAAINVSSATTGLILPPSNILIVYSLASGGVSIAALFVAGYVPGLLLGVALMAVAARLAPARVGRSSEADVAMVLLSALPSLGLPVVVNRLPAAESPEYSDLSAVFVDGSPGGYAAVLHDLEGNPAKRLQLAHDTQDAAWRLWNPFDVAAQTADVLRGLTPDAGENGA